MPEHNILTDPELHEPKGVAAATSGQTYVADGAAGGAWSLPEPKGAIAAANREIYVADGAASGAFFKPVRMGFQNYVDTATTTTPIVLTAIDTFFNMTNNGAGAGSTDTFKLTGTTDIFNTTTGKFDFTELVLGDTVDFRLDLDVETMGIDHEITVNIQLGQGGTPFDLNIRRDSFKVAAVYNITEWFSVFMGDTNTLNNPAAIRVASDSGTTNEVVVNGFYIRTLTRSNF